jgi:glycine oxidase
MAFWQQFASITDFNYIAHGSLVVAPARDQSLKRSFERLTQNHQRLDHAQLTALEPDLDHFEEGLFYPDEAHIQPRLATKALWEELGRMDVMLNTERYLDEASLADGRKDYDWQIDCRGLGAQSELEDLRGVKGEMLHIHSDEVQLSRPVRLLHPRYPLYIVPRSEQQFMVGATMIEANSSRNATVRSILEILSAAYVVHPAFAEAEIVEIGVDIRPAFNDNLPKIRRHGNQIYVNGLYRHGYLAAPALARRVSDIITSNYFCTEVVDANHSEWQNH